MSTINTGRATLPGAAPAVEDFDPFLHENFEFWKRARAETPVFWHEPTGAYWITRYADCDRVLGDRGRFVSARTALAPNIEPIAEAQRILSESGFVPGPSIVDEDGEDHARHRRATQPPFTVSRIGALREFVAEQIAARLDAFVAKAEGEGDIVEEVIYEIPGALILHMMGVPDEQLGMVKSFRGPWAVFQWGFPDAGVQVRTAEGMAQFGAWARALTARALADDSADDIIAETVRNLRAVGTMDDMAERLFLDSYTLNIVMAGHETTVNTMAGGLLALLRDREQWEAVVGNAELVPNAVEEMLRHATGVPTWRQYVVEDIELSGVTIPANSKVYCAIASANRDEEVFEDGERFDVLRHNASKHLAFGKGNHTCMGNHVSKMEMRMMLAEIARRLPGLELVADQEIPYSPNTSQRGPERLRVRWDSDGATA